MFDISGYNIYRSQISGGPYARINTTLIADTTYNDYNISPGITYYYCATAQIKAFAESRLSNETSAQLGIAEARSDFNSTIEIKPNPFKKELWIKGHGITKVKIFDISGRLRESLDGKDNIIWHAHGLQPGIYLIEIRQKDLKKIEKVIKIQ